MDSSLNSSFPAAGGSGSGSGSGSSANPSPPRNSPDHNSPGSGRAAGSSGSVDTANHSETDAVQALAIGRARNRVTRRILTQEVQRNTRRRRLALALQALVEAGEFYNAAQQLVLPSNATVPMWAAHHGMQRMLVRQCREKVAEMLAHLRAARSEA